MCDAGSSDGGCGPSAPAARPAVRAGGDTRLRDMSRAIARPAGAGVGDASAPAEARPPPAASRGCWRLCSRTSWRTLSAMPACACRTPCAARTTTHSAGVGIRKRAGAVFRPGEWARACMAMSSWRSSPISRRSAWCVARFTCAGSDGWSDRRALGRGVGRVIAAVHLGELHGQVRVDLLGVRTLEERLSAGR